MQNENDLKNDVRATLNLRRGVKEGTKRGTYLKVNEATKKRIIEAAVNGADWEDIVLANGCKLSSARRWITTGNCKNKQRGGKHEGIIKLNDAHEDYLLTCIEEDCQITLCKLKEKLMQKFGLKICESTISRHLENKLYTVKKVTTVPIGANTEQNIAKRRAFCENIMHLTGLGKQTLNFTRNHVIFR